MTGLGGPDLGALAARLADELDDVTVTQDAVDSVYTRAGLAFARATPDALVLRLPTDIAEAALRTPDTAPEVDGGGWVRFAPRSSERHVADRAEAWFRTAWRHAGPT